MTKNFIGLINEYQIIIPLIQRDYAQGRAEEKTKASNFLNAILNGLKNGLNLDFIYGKTEKFIFTPLDGQQRLTTLLLLHWYATLENNYLDNLVKFSYQVRSSTKDFIEQLTKKENWKKLKKLNIKSSIENSNWFFLSWKNDPTVVAILNMLNLIETKFININVKEFDKITFEILYLNDFKLTDELYVKMNARGKPLTEFENFKAEFEKYIDKADIKANLDNKWLDIFWEFAKKDDIEIDEAPKLADNMFYNFFYNITFNLYLEDIKVLECKGKIYSSIDNFIQECSIFDFYSSVYTKKENINKVVLILDNLKKDEYFKIFISNKKITQWERARFYALSLAYTKQLNEIEFKRWKRVTFNLINNQLIQSPEDLIKVIQSLKLLSSRCSNDIYNYINNDSSKIKSFTKIQREEESLKASLINNNSIWEDELIKTEKHWYLDGQIGFLLKFADNDIDKFIQYRDKFIAIWSLSENNRILIYQSLLTKGDYLPKMKSNYTFCSFETGVRAKLDNWQKVFNNNDDDYLKELLNDSKLNIANIAESLKDIIKEFISRFEDINGTFQDKHILALVSNSENIKYCKHLQLRYYEEEVYLLRKSRMNGTHVGLFSWNLFTKEFKDKIFTPFKTVKYIETSSSYEKPYILLDDFNNRYAIKISFNETFSIVFFKKKYKKGKIENRIVEILTNNNFILEGKEYIFKDRDLSDVNLILSIIKKLLKEFKI